MTTSGGCGCKALGAFALTDKEQRAFVRYSRGQDVMAACGQLTLVESPARA